MKRRLKGGSLLLCCTCARGLRMPPCLSCSWKFPLSAEIAPCVAGVEIRGRARRPAVVSLSCTRLRQNLHRERKARERKNTALRPLLLVPSARLATSVERKGEARQGAGGCFLWQVTASMRRREGQALRRKRPRYTKPATHGRLLAPFLAPIAMHPNRPLDLKIVFNQHPKPPNGITNVFRFSAHSGVVNFLFS